MNEKNTAHPSKEERENVLKEIRQLENRKKIQHRPEAQLQPVQTGLPAGAGADVLAAAGRLPD